MAQALIQARARGSSAAILLGAGASFSAGIPLAGGIVEAIRQRFPDAYERAQERTYPYVMSEITDGHRHDLIAGFVREARLNWAHLMLGWLVKTGHVGRILTTNFDNLTVRGAALFDVYPAVYDVTALGKFDAGMVADPAIFFLHGQHSGFVQLNTRPEVDKNAPRLRPVFEEANLRRPWIVLGYSGDNDPVFERLAAVKRFNYGLYWVGYRDSPPSQDVTRRLLGRGERQTYLVRGHDADSFMIALFRALGLEVPPLLSDPFAHGLKILEGIPPFPAGVHGDGLDLTAVARARLTAAQQWFIAGEPPIAVAALHAEQLVLTLQGYFLRGQYDTIIAKTEGVELPQSVTRVVAAAHAARAELRSEALHEGPLHDAFDADGYRAGLADYDRALALRPDFAELYNDRARLRLRASEFVQGEEFTAMIAAARADLDEAQRRKPGLAPVLHNLAYCEALAAQRQVGEARRVGSTRALAGFRRALEVDPDEVMTLVFTARILLNLDRSAATRQEVRALLDRAARREPRNYELLVTRLNLAVQSMDWDIDQLRAQGPELLAQAETLVEIEAREPRGQLMLGLVRMIQAMVIEGPEARAAFDEGRRVYEAVRARRPRILEDALGDADYAFACVLFIESMHRAGDERTAMIAAAEAGLEAAVEALGSPVLCLWGNLLEHAADQVQEPEATALTERAEAKYRAALARAPEDVEPHVELAELYVERITTADEPAVATGWYRQATELLDRAAAIDETREVRRARAAACRAYAEALDDEVGERRLLQEAIDRYERLVAEDDGDAEAWEGLARSAQAWAECFEEAPISLEQMRAAFRRAVEAHGKTAAYRGELGGLMYQVEVLSSWGEIEAELGNEAMAATLMTEVQALLERAVQRSPDDHELMLMLLGSHSDRGDRYGFAVTLRRALAMQPPLTRAELDAEEFELLSKGESDAHIRSLLDRFA